MTSGMILLSCITVALLQPVLDHGLAQAFTLRSQIDPRILESVGLVQKELSDGLLTDKGASRFSSLVELELKPLYFHIKDFAIQLSDMRLTSSELVLEETNLDVLGQRMMPLVSFQWAEVKGKLKTSLGTQPSQKYDFRLVQNHLQAKGVISLTVDLVNVMWSYFYFKPKSTSLEIKKGQSDVDSNIVHMPNSSEFAELLAKKLQRDISHQLTTIVSKTVNQTLKATSKMLSLQPYSDDISAIGVNNTENANTFIDSLFKLGGAMIRSKYGDRIRIPDIKEEFSEKFLINFRGSFRATEGAAVGTSAVYRVGDIVFGYDNESQLHFYGRLGFDSLHLLYDHYKAEMWGVGPSGSMDTKLSPLSVLVHVHLNTSSKIVSLEKFKITNVGDLSVSLTGLGGMLSWLVSRVTTWVLGLYRDQVIEQLEASYQQYGRDVFATYSLEELLNGGKNEAYVL